MLIVGLFDRTFDRTIERLVSSWAFLVGLWGRTASVRRRAMRFTMI